MAGEKEVKLILTAEDNISSVLKKVTEHLGETGMGQAVTAISTSFLAFEKVLGIVSGAIGKVYSTIEAGVKDAAAAETVNRRLAMSMASVGEYTESSFLDIQKFAGELESMTGVSDEAFRSLVSLGLQQGMNTEQAKKATKAALDLSAATGISMETAFQQMQMTMSGVAGRLEKVIPELRGLTKEELENGKAIDVIAKKYDGFAANTAQSFTGATARMDAQIANVKEAFGRMIAQNPAVIAAIDKVATLISSAAASMDEFSTWVMNNQEDLQILAAAFGIASLAVGAYVVYQNAAAIATIASKTAIILFNSAMALTPWGLAIGAIAALTAGLYFLYKNFDLVAGALKVGLGYALQAVTSQLTMFLNGLSKVVGFFNAEWGKSLENVATRIDSVSKKLIENGSAQMEAARAAKKSAEDQSTAAMTVERSTSGITNRIKETQQELTKLTVEFEKAASSAENAFAGVKDLMPRMNLEEFEKNSTVWMKQVQDLKTKAEALKVKLSINADDAVVKEQLQKIEQQIRYASEAEKALRIKNSIETRTAILKEEQIRLDQIRMGETTAAQEISSMRIQFAADSRNKLIQIETDRLLAQRGLASADAREGVTVAQAAQLAANDIELNSYRAGLEAKNQLALDMTMQKTLAANEIEMAAFTQNLENQKAVAVDIELQKQIAIAQVKADAMSASSAGGAAAGQDVEMLQAQAKQQELARLRDQDIISEQAYQQQLTDLKIQAIQTRTESEMMLNQQRIELLGISPEAQAAALENEKLNNETQLLMLREKLTAQMITEDEFRIMKEEAEMASAERQTQIKESYIQRDIQQNERLGNSWAVTLGKMRLEQQKHGQIMGTIRGIQQSTEYAGMQQGLSDIASLRSSGDKKAFEAGKAAAIAQTVTNTFMSATGAYASMVGIPIVGPALAVAAAAAAIAAGMNNVAQIKSQKFQGGQAHGGIDEVPKSMDNSTFVLKAGERVVQPDQNKELGMAIDKINQGGAGGNNISITVNGNADDSTVMKIKDAVIDAIRESSERGTPIMHEKGIVRA